VTTKTLRHYEKLGLLEPEREENGYRLYGAEDVLRVQRIRQLQSLGLSLKEVARLLEQEDERLWAGVLRSMREEAAAEIDVLQERIERIERLLSEGLPPDRESLPAAPDKVGEYLEQHLPQASLAAWQHETCIYASLRRFLGALQEDAYGAAWADSDDWQRAVLRPALPMMVPSQLGELVLWSAAANRNGSGHPGYSANGGGQPAILRAVQKVERLIEDLEDEQQ
jgi:DNA-binding transcriptional MerR regulator